MGPPYSQVKAAPRDSEGTQTRMDAPVISTKKLKVSCHTEEKSPGLGVPSLSK